MSVNKEIELKLAYCSHSMFNLIENSHSFTGEVSTIGKIRIKCTSCIHWWGAFVEAGELRLKELEEEDFSSAGRIERLSTEKGLKKRARI
jgi:hypothetical protein